MPLTLLFMQAPQRLWPPDLGSAEGHVVGSHGHLDGWLLHTVSGVPHPTGDAAEVPIGAGDSPVILAAGFERDRGSPQLACALPFGVPAFQVHERWRATLARALNGGLGRIPNLKVRESLVLTKDVGGKRKLDDSACWLRLELTEGDPQLGDQGACLLAFFGTPMLLRNSASPFPDLSGVKGMQLYPVDGETLDVELPEINGVRYDSRPTPEV